MLLRSGEVVVLALKLIKHFMGLVPDHVDKSFETQQGLEVHSGTLSERIPLAQQDLRSGDVLGYNWAAAALSQDAHDLHLESMARRFAERPLSTCHIANTEAAGRDTQTSHSLDDPHNWYLSDLSKLRSYHPYKHVAYRRFYALSLSLSGTSGICMFVLVLRHTDTSLCP